MRSAFCDAQFKFKLQDPFDLYKLSKLRLIHDQCDSFLRARLIKQFQRIDQLIICNYDNFY